jgi:dynein heavy chain
MFNVKPKKDNIGKVDGDTLGFFHCAKMNIMGNANKFKNDMIEYDKENISKEVVKKVNPILNDPSFDAQSIKNASTALLGIYKWAVAMMKYYELLKIVNPKREQVKTMTEKLKVVQAELDKKRKQLAQVAAKLAELEAQMNALMTEKESLEKRIADASVKLDRANKIIEGLSGEKQRWTETVAFLSDQYDLLIGNCLVAAGMVAYSGSFTAYYRNKMEDEWCKYIAKIGIKITSGMKMQTLLQDPVTTKTWT